MQRSIADREAGSTGSSATKRRVIGMKESISRRQFITRSSLIAGTALVDAKVGFASGENVSSAPFAEVSLKLLDGKPVDTETGLSFGVPFAKGVVKPGTKFALNASNKQLVLQSWPLAFWPDGSIKWNGFATVLPSGSNGPFNLSPVAAESAGTVKVTNNGGSTVIDTGVLKCSIPKAGGTDLIESMAIDDRNIVGAGQLVCILQNGPDGSPEETLPREKFTSLVKRLTVEQSGPVRAVVKFEGVHRGVKTGREWLPFHVRLYFYSGQTAVRMLHTIFFDGDQEKDFIHGLRATFAVPMREEVQNRHVRFSGEGDGLWSEPIQPLVGRAGPTRIVTDAAGKDVYTAQLDGLRVPNRAEMNDQGRRMVADWAIWDDFKLVQPNPDGFTIQKRTNPKSTWLFSTAGKRSSGYAFVGDVSGGLGVSLKNFWQSYPTELQIQNASSQNAQLTAWVWSPESASMDLRHYDTRAHGLEAAYEDVQPGNSTPYGIARTSELTLWLSKDVPGKNESAKMANAGAVPAVMTCSPQYYHDVRAFGVWSVRDTSTPFKTSIESGLDSVLDLYVNQIDERDWYGFWNYGDVMHSFDNVRKVWRYDLGGMAWDNSELATDTWLWYSFLRTGRSDVFRLAEAMTRHTGEVDTYHFGPMAGLGTRHGVTHWGDGAKEARIGQAAFRRFYYYLTADERTGDVMREAVQAEKSIISFDPMRLADPPRAGDEKFVARIRSGPDWLAIAGNWFTEWERTGDAKWRDKILAGMRSMISMPNGFRTGKNMLMGFDPVTGVLTARDTTLGTYNLATIMGGAEMMFEMNLSFDDPAWKKVWADFCANSGASISAGKLQAYAYFVTKEPALAKSAVASLRPGRGGPPRKTLPPHLLSPTDDGTDTNGAAQSSLNAIAVLEMCSDALPTTVPAQ
ncbi:MAG: hypothetical protein QM785_09510 [Pyrinomonadaceae bacterium]